MGAFRVVLRWYGILSVAVGVSELQTVSWFATYTAQGVLNQWLPIPLHSGYRVDHKHTRIVRILPAMGGVDLRVATAFPSVRGLTGGTIPLARLSAL
jgi:hypothetical protein